MKKAILCIVAAVCVIGFVVGAAALGAIISTYRSAQQVYGDTAQLVTSTEPSPGFSPQSPEVMLPLEPEEEEIEMELVELPIHVDFDKLREINPDVVGWLYCEGTVIDYPVLQGEDNDFYLHHDINGSYNLNGSIFVEALNQRGFEDYNNIIYGHHMANGTMLACIEKYAKQEYYEEHPVMWLLTPTQDYKLVLFSGYVTDGESEETYVILNAPGKELDAYIERALELSDFEADVEFTGKDKLAVMSTCNYSFGNARYVVHGILRPVKDIGSAQESNTEQTQIE